MHTPCPCPTNQHKKGDTASTVKTAIEEWDSIYFITFTCQGWQPLFERTGSYDAVYQWV